MLVIENYSLAVVLCVMAMVCWGSWQNTRNMIGSAWRFELFYWDFIAGILLLSIVGAFTVGSMGQGGRAFLADLAQADTSYIFSALLGGVIWNAGTLLLVAAISLTGMAIAFPIGGGIGWVLGIVINYMASPVGNAMYLFVGCAFIVAAILVSVMVNKAKSDSQTKSSTKGVVLAVMAGFAIALFYRFVAAAVFTDYANPEAGKISPYTGVVMLALGAFLSTFIFNSYLMAKPVEGEPVTFVQYAAAPASTHAWGIVGGVIWNMGTLFSFMASGAAGFAISYGLSNSAPVVAALWGIFAWKEFKGSPQKVYKLLALMFAFYAIGLGFIMYSRLS